MKKFQVMLYVTSIVAAVFIGLEQVGNHLVFYIAGEPCNYRVSDEPYCSEIPENNSDDPEVCDGEFFEPYSHRSLPNTKLYKTRPFEQTCLPCTKQANISSDAGNCGE